jgi:hypothetical protein
MDIKTIEAVARQKISLSAIRPSTNRQEGNFYTVEFNSGVSVSVTEAEQFALEDTGHHHNTSKCIGCIRISEHAQDAGFKLGEKHEKEAHPRVTREQILAFLNEGRPPSIPELADWIYSKIK